MAVENINLKDFTLNELEKYFEEIGQPRFRARQVADWIFQKGARSFEVMTNLPAPLRSQLAQVCTPGGAEIIQKQVSSRGGTAKYLFRLADGQAVETVLMRYSYGRSVCVSTQVGCRMNCAFCASSLGGRVRNLSAGEIYDQVLAIQADTGERVSHIVLMGSGEPLDNYDNTLKFIININSAYGLNIGFRHITLSTCGVAPRIRQLAGEGMPITLAVSLHAPENGLRDQLIPLNRKYPLETLMEACSYYSSSTGRRITFEYILLAGVNDSTEQAGTLARLIRGIPCLVNLIPYNPVRERPFKRPVPVVVQRFKAMLDKAGVESTVRRELGADIDAACGQLRRNAMSLQTE